MVAHILLHHVLFDLRGVVLVDRRRRTVVRFLWRRRRRRGGHGRSEPRGGSPGTRRMPTAAPARPHGPNTHSSRRVVVISTEGGLGLRGAYLGAAPGQLRALPGAAASQLHAAPCDVPRGLGGHRRPVRAPRGLRTEEGVSEHCWHCSTALALSDCRRPHLEFKFELVLRIGTSSVRAALVRHQWSLCEARDSAQLRGV